MPEPVIDLAEFPIVVPGPFGAADQAWDERDVLEQRAICETVTAALGVPGVTLVSNAVAPGAAFERADLHLMGWTLTEAVRTEIRLRVNGIVKRGGVAHLGVSIAGYVGDQLSIFSEDLNTTRSNCGVLAFADASGAPLEVTDAVRDAVAALRPGAKAKARARKPRKRAPIFLAGEAIHSISVSPDGRLIASNDLEQRLSLWDAASGALVWSKRVGGSGMNFATVSAFSPDSRRIVSGSAKLKTFDVETGKPVDGPRGHPKGEVVDLVWAEETIASVSRINVLRRDNSVALWRPDGALLKQWKWGSPYRVVVLPEALVVMAYDEQEDTDVLCRVDPTTGETLVTRPVQGDSSRQLAVASDRAWVTVRDTGFCAYDLRTLEPVATVDVTGENLATATPAELVTYAGSIVRRRSTKGDILGEWSIPEVRGAEAWVDAVHETHEYSVLRVEDLREIRDVEILPNGHFAIAAGCAIHVMEPDGTPVRVASVP